MIRWKRADDGFVESHDGEWFITPLYCGCTRPQAFELRHKDNYAKSLGEHRTQKEAKDWAEYLKEKQLSAVGKR